MNEYLRELEEWRRTADESLRRHWLPLAGLFWLEEGRNLVGPGAAVDLPRALGTVGEFDLSGEDVVFRGRDPRVHAAGTVVEERRLLPDGAEGTPDIEFDGYRMRLVRRGGTLAVRLWDHAKLIDFPGRIWYDANPEFRVEGALEPYAEPHEVEVPTALGYSEKELVLGEIVFSLPGGEGRLPAFGDEDELFLIFRDTTAADTTYGGGRYLTAPRIDGHRYLVDFNRAFNPPCAVTPYATCSMPPREAMLSFAIPAGEKYRGH